MCCGRVDPTGPIIVATNLVRLFCVGTLYYFYYEKEVLQGEVFSLWFILLLFFSTFKSKMFYRLIRCDFDSQFLFFSNVLTGSVLRLCRSLCIVHLHYTQNE